MQGAAANTDSTNTPRAHLNWVIPNISHRASSRNSQKITTVVYHIFDRNPNKAACKQQQQPGLELNKWQLRNTAFRTRSHNPLGPNWSIEYSAFACWSFSRESSTGRSRTGVRPFSARARVARRTGSSHFFVFIRAYDKNHCSFSSKALTFQVPGSGPFSTHRTFNQGSIDTIFLF